MRIAVLAENTALCDSVTPQHGLSLYLETGNCKILFDMGQDDTFARNAQTLGIDLSQVDFAVVSHGHYDHGGGLQTFLEINHTAPIYIHREAFGAYYNGTQKYIGLDPDLRNTPRLILTDANTAITPSIRLTDGNEQGWHVESWGLSRMVGDTFCPDGFAHEQYLEITEDRKRIVISGCSHKGIVNIAEHFHPDVLIGGFHLNKVEDDSVLESIARRLFSCNSGFYTGHCTGERQFLVLKNVMGDRLQRLSTGCCIEI